jgi:cytochrome c6
VNAKHCSDKQESEMNLAKKASMGLLVLGLMLPTLSLAADAGPELFKTKCQGCHGPNGDASTPMAKNMKVRELASADVQKQSDSDLKNEISKGKGKMPAFGSKLSDTQIDDLVKYIRSLKK